MGFTSRNPITVVKNGVETRLDTLAYNVETRTGVATSLSASREGAVSVAGRSGSFYQPGAKREEGRVVLSMWVSDDRTDGFYNTGYKAWRDNLDTLNRLFDTSLGQIEVREYIHGIASPSMALTGQPYRRAFCEVRTTIQPDMEGRWYGPLKVELIINNTFWEDSAAATFTSPVGATAVATHTMTPLVGGTAPIEDANITVTGPISAPTLRCAETGSLLRYTGTLAAGQQWSVNTSKYLSAVGTNIEASIFAGNFAGTSATANTLYSGPHSPTMFPIGPLAVVQLSGSGAGTATALKIAARKKYH